MNADNTSERAVRVELSNRRQNWFVFYLCELVAVLLALAVRLIALAPLYALYAFPDSPLKYLALLCPVLIFFLVLPLRFSFADALAQEHGERYFSIGKAFSLRKYGEKLQESTSHFLSVLKWAIPLILALGFLAYQLGYISFGKAKMDFITMYSSLDQLGLWAGNLWAGVSGVAVQGGAVEGVVFILGILALLYILLMFGAVRNSARRYVWALSTREDKNAYVETRRRLAGRRLKQLLVALINLCLLLPALALIAYSLKDTLIEVSGQMTQIVAGNAKITSLAGALKNVLLIFFLIYIPLLPVRRLLNCLYATHASRARKATRPLDEATQAAQAAKSEAE